MFPDCESKNYHSDICFYLTPEIKTSPNITWYQHDCFFLAMVNSDWTIGSFFEKKLMPLPISLQLTGSYNIKKDKVSCGIGAVLG